MKAFIEKLKDCETWKRATQSTHAVIRAVVQKCFSWYHEMREHAPDGVKKNIQSISTAITKAAPHLQAARERIAQSQRIQEVESFAREHSVKCSGKCREFISRQWQRIKIAFQKPKSRKVKIWATTVAVVVVGTGVFALVYDFSDFGQCYRAAKRGDVKAQFLLGIRYEYGRGVDQDSKKAVEWWRKAAKQGHTEAQYQLAHKTKGKEAFKWMLKAAKGGHTEAQYELAERYYVGEGVDKDVRQAAKWYSRAAEKKHADAQFSLGLISCDEGNEDEGFKWFYKAAEQGHAGAQYNLGVCYHTGKGVKRDDNEAAKWFRNAAKQKHEKAEQALAKLYKNHTDTRVAAYKQGDAESLRQPAEEGDAVAQLALATCYWEGKGVAKDQQEALKWLQKAASQGHRDAQAILGSLYSRGEGVPKDMGKSAHWLRLAATQGDAEAQFKIGALYYMGEGVPKDQSEALRWFHKSADQGNKDAIEFLSRQDGTLRADAEAGDAEAQLLLGSAYLEGEGVPQNINEAVRWIRLSATNGNYLAQMQLGNLYYDGNGVCMDRHEALCWYLKSAEQGFEAAQFKVGACYYMGEGVAKDDKKAFTWWLKAAEQGYADAQYRVALCYLKGMGVEENHDQAAKWMVEAARQGNEEALKVLKEFGVQLQ